MTSDRARRNRLERARRAEETRQRYRERIAAEERAEVLAAERAAEEARRVRDAEARERLRRQREREEYAYGIGLERGRDDLGLYPIPMEVPGDLVWALRGGHADGQGERHRAFRRLVGLLKWRARLLGDPPPEGVPAPRARNVVAVAGRRGPSPMMALLLMALATGGGYGGERF